jgi:2-hydroxy-3-keto-5-methylthiopentenyl-1-phosphate phosphatase
MQVFCDFDGTISKEDVTDLVLDRFARAEWREIEDQWTNGRITSAQCMHRQIQLLQARREDIDAFLDTIEIDNAFGAFKAFCEKNGLELVIVSDGVDHFIRRVLARHGLDDIRIIANRLVSRPHVGMPEFDLGFPFKSASCTAGAGVCKCAQVRPSGNHVYIGDGRSDFCVSHEALLVFAKARLADYCRANCLPFIPYSGFAEIQASVATILSSPSRQPVVQAVAKTA